LDNRTVHVIHEFNRIQREKKRFASNYITPDDFLKCHTYEDIPVPIEETESDYIEDDRFYDCSNCAHEIYEETEEDGIIWYHRNCSCSDQRCEDALKKHLVYRTSRVPILPIYCECHKTDVNKKVRLSKK